MLQPAQIVRIAAQVEAGADVAVAPTWLTHRRALLPLGESRRARAWTAAAVQVARDGVELGLERRSEDKRESESPDAATPVVRPAPLIAAVMPPLEHGTTSESGRLLPRDAATQRDYREQAGLLADAEPDLILVETSVIATEARIAVQEAAETGLRTWAAAPAQEPAVADEGAWLSRWLESSRHAGAQAVLLPGPPDRAGRLLGGATSHWGGWLGPATTGAPPASMADATSVWLEHGAGVLAMLDGATPARLGPVRAAIDAHEAVGLEAQARLQERFEAHAVNAARTAPGGAALWLAGVPDGELPPGFRWLIADETEIRRFLPAQFCLIVMSATGPLQVERLAPLLRDGGIFMAALDGLAQPIDGLRMISLDTSARPTLMTLRRED